MVYKVAEHFFSIYPQEKMESWCAMAPHYEPFLVESSDLPLFDLNVCVGMLFCENFPRIFANNPAPGELSIAIYSHDDRGYIFEFKQFDTPRPDAWLMVSPEFIPSMLIVNETDTEIPVWKHYASLTSGIMLAYLLATTPHLTLMAHASSVICGDRAMLFIAPSGTGKSTHARLWVDNIPGAMLLNDDHPIVRFMPDGVARVFGSPWSGKTDCYINRSAPLAAVVRIRQSAQNQLTRLTPPAAYASLMTSFSYMPGVPALADARHASIERLATAIPAYTLDCRPDAEAAKLCFDNIL